MSAGTIQRKIEKHIEFIGYTENFSNGNLVYTFPDIIYAKASTEKLEPPKLFVYPDEPHIVHTEASTRENTPTNTVDDQKKGLQSKFMSYKYIILFFEIRAFHAKKFTLLLSMNSKIDVYNLFQVQKLKKCILIIINYYVHQNLRLYYHQMAT